MLKSEFVKYATPAGIFLNTYMLFMFKNCFQRFGGLKYKKFPRSAPTMIVRHKTCPSAIVKERPTPIQFR